MTITNIQYRISNVQVFASRKPLPKDNLLAIPSAVIPQGSLLRAARDWLTENRSLQDDVCVGNAVFHQDDRRMMVCYII